MTLKITKDDYTNSIACKRVLYLQQQQYWLVPHLATLDDPPLSFQGQTVIRRWICRKWYKAGP